MNIINAKAEFRKSRSRKSTTRKEVWLTTRMRKHLEKEAEKYNTDLQPYIQALCIADIFGVPVSQILNN